MPTSRGKTEEIIDTGIPDLKLVRFENRQFLYLRIYDRNRKVNVLKALKTADPTLALRTYPEIYQQYLANPVVPRIEKKTLTDLIDIWIRHINERYNRKEIALKTKVAKINTIEKGVIPYMQHYKLLRICDVNPKKDFSKYVEWRLSQNYKRSSISTEIKHLKEFIRYLHLKGYVKDPVVDLTLPRQTYEAQQEEDSITSFTDEQLDEISTELIERIINSEGEEKYRWKMLSFFCDFMLDSGMRTDEAYWITFGQCRVRGQKGLVKKECAVQVNKSKTGPRQTIFESSIIHNLMETYKELGIKILPDTPLWVNPTTGKRFYRGWFARWFREILNDLGYGFEYRLYSYRHTMITQAIERGIDLHTIGKLVGNSSNEISQTYDHVVLAMNTKNIFKDERSLEEDTFQSVVG